jgi:hypothetical protein
VTFKAAANDLTVIDLKLVKRLKNSILIDFTNNTCIDSVYDKNASNSDELNVLFGNVVLNCSGEQVEED